MLYNKNTAPSFKTGVLANDNKKPYPYRIPESNVTFRSTVAHPPSSIAGEFDSIPREDDDKYKDKNNDIHQHIIESPQTAVNLGLSLTTDEYLWDDKIEHILDQMRINCVNLSEYHIYKHRRLKWYLMSFRVPVIILSGVNVFSAVGLQPYVSQGHISVINSILSLVCGALTSIELFLNIQKKMETDLVSHKDYYRLAIDIYKVISLERSARKVDGKTFLDQKFSEYEKLIESSNIVDNDYLFDTLASSYPIMMNSGQNNEEIGRTYQNTLVGTSNSYHQTKLAKLSYRKEQTAMHFYNDKMNGAKKHVKLYLTNESDKLYELEESKKPKIKIQNAITNESGMNEFSIDLDADISNNIV